MAVILRVGVLAGEKLRCMGSGLSPNGLPFSGEGVVSLALLDNIKYLDLQKGRITVEAGARIQPVSLLPFLRLPASCFRLFLLAATSDYSLDDNAARISSLIERALSSRLRIMGCCN